MSRTFLYQKDQKVQHKIGKCTFAFHVSETKTGESGELLYFEPYGENGRWIKEGELSPCTDRDESRSFLYVFEDGFETYSKPLPTRDLAHLQSTHGLCTFNGYDEHVNPKRHGIGICIIGGANSRGDAFRTGWNPALGMEIKSPSHFKSVLKEKGLVEVGNEKTKSAPMKKKSYIDDEIIKQAVDSGAKISGQEAEALKNGNLSNN